MTTISGDAFHSLHSLLRRFEPRLALLNTPDLKVTGVAEDSRRVAPGNLFIARAGGKADGRAFIADAAARGAVAVVTQSAIAGCALPQIVLGCDEGAPGCDAGAAASVLANLFHGSPSRAMRTLAVTGTNGKTTTTYLLRDLLKHVGTRCGLIGTVQIDDGRVAREAEMTTPAACDVAELLATMRDHDCGAAVLEASSHALEQKRLAGVTFAGGAFTNLTGDHLDYHGTMESYAAAKAKLFESLDAQAVAVVNADDAWSDRMIRDCAAKIIRFGFQSRADHRAADYWATDVAVTARGNAFILHTPDGHTPVQTKLIGRHNIENALTAAALAGEVCGLSVQQIAAGLREATGAPGRLQPVEAGQPFAVLVDYAHTDDAMENVLSALRPLASESGGKLRVLFGCGGDRDNTKRPRMAKAAEKFADVVYVTSDNPRTEDPKKIIEQILPGFSQSSAARRVVEPDRRAAIERIISDAGAGDIVLLAGKGHENYQIIGTQKHHFDDVEEARRVLQTVAA